MIDSAEILILADNASRGFAIAITGMLIVAMALTLITIFIAALPRVLSALEAYLPDLDEAHVKRGHPESNVPDDDAVTAAIGFVLHTEFQKQLARDRAEQAKT